jgi:hypothetical protein
MSILHLLHAGSGHRITRLVVAALLAAIVAVSTLTTTLSEMVVP